MRTVPSTEGKKPMGMMRHHMIAVTSWDKQSALEALLEARRVFGSNVSGLVQSKVNVYYTFFVGPDGSKEGWPDSVQGDEDRAKFISWLRMESGPCSYVEIAYGGDFAFAEVVEDSNKDT